MTDPATDPADDRPVVPDSFADFARRFIEAGVIPELAPWQEAFLEVLDGTRPPMTAAEAAYAARRAGRRHIRAIVAAATILSGQEVRFVARTAAEAARMYDDAVALLEDYGRALGAERPRLTLTIHDEQSLEGASAYSDATSAPAATAKATR